MITRLMNMKTASKTANKWTIGGQTKGKQRATNKNDKNDKNKKENNKKEKIFIPPTLDDINNYVSSKNLNVNSKQFYN